MHGNPPRCEQLDNHCPMPATSGCHSYNPGTQVTLCQDNTRLYLNEDNRCPIQFGLGMSVMMRLPDGTDISSRSAEFSRDFVERGAFRLYPHLSATRLLLGEQVKERTNTNDAFGVLQR